ncbi:MAG: sensor histidine kinase [Actinobacteria bacterium]|nr:sensor histidine kinase [Actinomycetota bacterium]
MNLRRIKVLAIVLSSAGLVAFEGFRHLVLHPLGNHPTPHFQEHVISGAMLFVAVVVFSFVIFRLLERLHDQLRALNEAAIAVTADLSVDRVLERVAELARTVAGASFAAVRVEGDPGTTVTAGSQPDAAPALVLPIVVRGDRLGELVLAGPRGRRFRRSDRRALETFATQAGIALENARLFEQVQELVATRERARIGMDLHDGLIQELYALGLKVEDAEELASTEPEETARVMRDVRGGLRGVIGKIRTYVYGLRDGDRSVDLRPALERLVGEFPSGRTAIGLDLAEDARLPAATAAHLLHIVREALANALRHAGAPRVMIRTRAEGEALAVCVEDDGRGFDPAVPSAGLGIRDMRERAEWCRSRLTVSSAPGEGTSVRIEVPLEPVGLGRGAR